MGQDEKKPLCFSACMTLAVDNCRGSVESIIDEKDARGVKEMLLRDLDLEQVHTFLHPASFLHHRMSSAPCISILWRCKWRSS